MGNNNGKTVNPNYSDIVAMRQAIKAKINAVTDANTKAALAAIAKEVLN